MRPSSWTLDGEMERAWGEEIDPQDSAIAALALVDIARDPKRKARLGLIPSQLLPKDAVEVLESAAWQLSMRIRAC